ncbi:MAG: hypothetical protein OEY93_12450, partial [Anaerolineae bacterium]|nr:hypothetical protein [Anaerolineae bacterium]
LYPEVLRYIVPEAGRNQLITPKNLYMRILAETGIIGFASFASFVIAVFGCALFLFTSKNVFENYFGVVGLVMIFVFLLSANSYDSFSFPNMWFMFGIITGAAHLFRNDQNQENSAMV